MTEQAVADNQMTFRAPDVLSALEQVQNQLGPEAMIVAVRQVTAGPLWKIWKGPEVEVIAVPSGAGASSRASGGTPVADKSDPQPSQVIGGRRETAQPSAGPQPKPTQTVEAFPWPVAAPIPAKQSVKLPAHLQALRDRMLANHINPDYVELLVKNCLDTLSPGSQTNSQKVVDHVCQQLAARIRLPRSAQIGLEGGGLFCLVGSSGSGKTSTCAKLAVHFIDTVQTNARQRVHWVCADTVSAGAIDEARLYTETLGVALHIAYTPADLGGIVAQIRKEQDPDAPALILVDMPGFNPYRESSIVELGELITVLKNRSIFMILPANGKEEDLKLAIASLQPFDLEGLVFTRIDETGTYGNVYNLAASSLLPIAYVSTGSHVMGSLRPVRKEQFVSALLSNSWPA